MSTAQDVGVLGWPARLAGRGLMQGPTLRSHNQGAAQASAPYEPLDAGRNHRPATLPLSSNTTFTSSAIWAKVQVA